MDAPAESITRTREVSPELDRTQTPGREALWALLYFGVYFCFLWYSPENEFRHWLSLVLIPFALAALVFQRGSGFRAALGTFGLRRETLKNGIGWAILIGLALSALQLFVSRNSGDILAAITSGRALYLFPLTLLVMMLTAGFTEEFFFRGFLQTRLQERFGSKTLAVLAVSLLFGIYHLPYAYLNPQWPSHGHFPAAIAASLGQGIPMGLILGAVYTRTKNNLLASVLVHSLLNSLPGMLSIKFGG